MAEEHTVELRELRHNTGDVFARVRHGETLDVTEHGRLIARIVPAQERTPAPVLTRIAESGRLRRAERPGYRPRRRAGEGTDLLGDALAELRRKERW